MATPIFFIVMSLLLSSPISFSTESTPYSLSKGSSLSVEATGDVLSSPNGIFSAGFIPVGVNAYCFAIWFSEPSCVNNCTVVWMANRDEPVNGRRSKLSLLESGNLILTDAGRFTVWSTDTASLSFTYLNLYDSGNLVLHNSKGVMLWQSFDSPTDTLLPQQPLTRYAKLVSSRSQSNYSSGFYKLFFDDDNVVRLLYDGPKTASIFWPAPWLVTWDAGRSAYNDSRIAVLDSFGRLISSDNFTILSADYGTRLLRRLTIDFDGNLRLYSRGEGRGTWVVSWQAMPQPCMTHGACGPNSMCTYIPGSHRKCSCIAGHKMIDHADWSSGCEPEFNVSCADGEASFVKFPHVEFYGYDLGFYENYSIQMCEGICLKLCDCKGFQMKFAKLNRPKGVPYCYPKIQLLNGQRTPNFDGDFYLKVPKDSVLFNESAKEFSLDCSHELIKQLDRSYTRNKENESLKFLLWSACTIGGVEILSIFFVWCFLFRTQQKSAQGYHLATIGIRKFTYSELKKSTKSFSKEIARGAGGIVYKGVLSDQRVAAIKRLNEANQGESEFLAEVRTIGRLNHMNLIGMWGYCAEGKHRLLVYEYMEHGSLADKLSSNTLDWEKRFEIAVGTAKGLAYLHEECLEWVLHCDVKPQNILLDSNYQPKVSDFGLSRLLSRVDHKNSSFSRIRGTRGYMAPEWLSNQHITSKVDVYSYGIVLLEIVTGKSLKSGVNSREEGTGTEKRSLVSWVRDKMNESTAITSWMEEIIDPMLVGKYDKARMETLIVVTLQCVEKDKDARPTMSQVVEMLLRHENQPEEYANYHDIASSELCQFSTVLS